MAEPNAALTYSDLILAVAEQLGVAYYGAAGDEIAQIPVDVFTLDRCKRYVQDGIRMAMADAPLAGWRWQRPLAQVDLWTARGIAMPPSSAGPNSATSAYVVATTLTHVYTETAFFSASMVGQVIAVRGVGLFTVNAYVSTTEVTLTAGTDFSWTGSKTFTISDPTGAATMTGVWDTAVTTTITASAGTFFPSTAGMTLYVTDEADGRVLGTYVSDTVMTLADATGGEAWTGAKTFNLASKGIYALPQNFGGEMAGDITYAAGSHLGVSITWANELEIRRLRENWNDVSSNPYYAAVRRNQTDSRRWDLLVYPDVGADCRIEFPYIVYFDKITNLTDMHVAGFAHDELIKWAAKAQAEMQGEDRMAGAGEYYRQIALPNSHRIDGRAAPRKLGYCGNPSSGSMSHVNFRSVLRRPTVGYRQ